MNMVEGTVDLTREFKQPAGAVFRAWSLEEAQREWGDPGEGWTMTFDQFRFAVGEADICRFGPKAGPGYVNVNRYLAIEPDQRIVYSTSLSSEGRLTFAGTVVVRFEAMDGGTRMRLVEQGLYLDPADSVEAHRAGWDGMLTSLGRYLENEPG